MLKGDIIYKTTHYSDGSPYNARFHIEGADTSDSITMRIGTNDYEAVTVMNGNPDFEELQTRRFDVNMATIKVETVLAPVAQKNGTVKDKPRPVNNDFFVRLGATMRYAKLRCTSKNVDDYSSLSLISTEFYPNTCQLYNIPDKYGNKIGTVVLDKGAIVAMNIETDLFKIDIKEEVVFDMEAFSKVTCAKNMGFKMNKETLGFEPFEKAKELGSSEGVVGLYKNLDEVIKYNPDREFEWLRGKNYIIVTDDILDEVCEKIYNHDGFVIYDTETTGLNITFKSREGKDDILVGVVLSVEFGTSYFFPTNMRSITNLCGGDDYYFMEHYMRPILEEKELVAHNMSFDWKVAYIYGINANIVHDTMAIFQLTYGAEVENFKVGLKELTRMFLHRDSLELSDLVRDGSWGDDDDIKFWDLPEELVRFYAPADTDNTLGLLQYAINNDLLHKYNATKVYEIEIAFSYAVAYQEFYGHCTDVSKVKQLEADVEKGISENMKKMEEIAGHTFNPNSPKDLMQVMYVELGIPEQISRKTGNPTTDKNAIKVLAEMTDENDEPLYPFVQYLSEYRAFEGLRKNFIKNLPTLCTEDGFMFSHVMQYGTTTGRVSINKPNYQSYNDTIKKYIIPREGYYATDQDYSSVEYRVLGNMSGNQMIKDGFVDPDFDYHQYQAARMYNLPYASVTKKMRKRAKSINFGLPYGMGDESLGASIFGEVTKENTRQAAHLRNKYFEGQEDVKEFFERARAGGVKNGYTETFFGRRRYYHRNKFSVAAIRRQSGNQVIQGCLDGDTRIQTQDFGIVKIKDVVGYNLNVWDGKQWTRGDITYSGKKQKCIVKFKGGLTMVCSPIHKFLVRSHRGTERFVECKDLLTLETTKNAHRVVVSQDYTPSDFYYNSGWAYKYKGTAHNSKDLFLEDIGDSFDMGVMLGRLASDGTISDREDGGCSIRQIVAEHEYNILPELRRCMAELDYVETDKGIREGRNEGVTYLDVYSKSLVKEIKELDIKHQVHDNIFQDTELLRGFLSGFFDGDGGISGKRIALTFGTQYDFEPMCLDLQKALLFLGIRSRYHKYSDRYVLSIKTTDNQRFLDMVGFLNQDKQDKGRQLECKEDEHIFGRCLIVESVEITDEYIDMYDVCNTERGYYVADGVITHNTAADIYKLAVGRLFKRICKEGWLGKVLFTGFIHDEIFCEVHNSIDPMKWLKVTREEFEVKMDGWCPLYMGFGFGMCWYEAKSVELPIRLQWELVEKYGETGYPDWHGDGNELAATVPSILRDFHIRDCWNQLTDKENQGNSIKPALNTELFDVLKTDKKAYNNIMQGYNENNEQEILQKLGEEHIEGLLRDENGVVITELEETDDTQLAIHNFCQLHNYDRSKIDVKNIEEVTEPSKPSNSDVDVEIDYYDDEDISAELERQRKLAEDARLLQFGLCIDNQEDIVTLNLDVNPKVIEFVRQHSVAERTGYRIMFKSFNQKKTFTTDKYLPASSISIVQKMYLQALQK